MNWFGSLIDQKTKRSVDSRNVVSLHRLGVPHRKTDIPTPIHVSPWQVSGSVAHTNPKPRVFPRDLCRRSSNWDKKKNPAGLPGPRVVYPGTR